MAEWRTAVPDQTETTLRDMVRHEAEQAHRRVSWLGNFQGFLFAALGLSWGKDERLLVVIEVLGLVIAALVLIGNEATALALLRIHRRWLGSKPKDGASVFGYFPERAPYRY